MLTLGSVVWGVRDVPEAIGFWGEALDYEPLYEPSDDWAILVPREGPGQGMSIKLVTSDPLPRQRHHLDLYASDQSAEVDRLIGLGARTVEWAYEEDADYVVLADP
ncbi:MAG TPA: VOC family protein, partial [Acidimicrobiia bacterium]|nr:VOC family protein [Acidimicrobiia bacterium]